MFHPKGSMMKYRWTEDDVKTVKEKRVRGGVGGGAIKRDSPEPIRNSRKLVANPAPSPNKPPYKSKLEFAWALRLEVMKREGQIEGWLYEPFTFKLAEGKRYRADFIAWGYRTIMSPDGDSVSYQEVIAYECKGWHKNYRDSLTHLSWAAQRFPFFQWKKVVRNGKTGFEVYDVVV